MHKESVICAWSGGKDSALMLQALRISREYAPAMLLTTVTEPFNRISMHGVRAELLERQATALGLPLYKVYIPWPCPNGVYEDRMAQAYVELKQQGYETFAFGDLFLEDVRAYRDRCLAQADMRAVYPLWGQETKRLARRFIDEGFRAVLCCVDSAQIPAGLAGRDYDAVLLADLPETADPCGENGEFHTFVTNGPGFSHGVPCIRGEVVIRDGFAYCDLLPAGEDATHRQGPA